MSSMMGHIGTRFSANAGNTIAVMNQIAGGMTNIGRASMQAQRQSGLFNQQMRAIGTTIRYALAGGAVFGMTRMLNTLRETQKQFALIRVLGNFDEVQGGVDKANRSLNKLYNDVQVASQRALSPVGEFNDALVNLYSTVGDIPPDTAVKMVEEISKGAQLAQVPVDDLTRAVTGMFQAFEGRGAQSAADIAPFIRGFQMLTAEAPGGIAFGPQFIQALPQLSATARFANVRPAEMLGNYLTALRTGGSPQSAGRGLQYLYQSIGVPQSKEAAKALRQAGITPTSVQQEGGEATLFKILNYARGLGLTPAAEKRIKGLTEEQADLLEGVPADQQAKTLGISGPGMEWLSQAIGRIHGVRTLIALAAQSQDPKNDQVVKDIMLIQDVMSGHAEATREWEQAWSRFAKDQPLQAATIALDNIKRDIADSLEPILNFGARQISKATPVLQRNEKWVDRGVWGALAVGGVLGGAKMLGAKGIPGLTRPAQLALAGEATMRNVQGILGGDPMHPMYVTVVGPPLFGPGFGSGSGSRNPLEKDLPGKRGIGGWLKAAAAGAAGYAARGIRGGVRGAERGLTRAGGRAFPFLARHPYAAGGPAALLTETLGALVFPEDVAAENIPMMRANMRADELARSGQLGGVRNFENVRGYKRIQGTAMVSVNLNIKDATGRVRTKRVHVPLNLWENGATPSNRGKAGG